jgi:hypothetical protein
LSYFLISIHTPAADGLAEELGQRLLAKQIVNEGFELTTYNSHASLEFTNVSNDLVESIMTEATDWLEKKHSTLMHRRTKGTRQKQSLGISKEPREEVVCLEIRK